MMLAFTIILKQLGFFLRGLSENFFPQPFSRRFEIDIGRARKLERDATVGYSRPTFLQSPLIDWHI